MRVLAVIVVTLASAACRPAMHVGGTAFCAPPVAIAVTIAEDPPPPKSAPRAARIAALLGLSDTLARAEGGDSLSTEARLAAVERIQIARVAIAAISAELDCESERTRQASIYLEHRLGQSVRNLTVASIVTGAATGTTSAILDETNTSPKIRIGVAVSGGLLAAGLGLAELFVNPHIQFEHERNLLADIWYGPAASSVYPPLLWAYLTRPEFSNTQRRSIRENIVSRWKRFGSFDVATDAPHFGKGGEYDVGDLRARTAMLEQVKAEVELANQEIADLAFKLHVGKQ